MSTKEIKPKRKAITVKEKRFVKELATADSLADAVRKAGYKVSSPQSASQIGYENMQKLDIAYYLHLAGLTDETMAQNTARIALTAKKQNQYTGEIEDDNTTQLKGMEFAAKLKKMIGSDSQTNIQKNNMQPVLVKFMSDEE